MRFLTPLTLSLAALAAATTDPLSLQMAHSITSRHEGIYASTGDSSGPLQAGLVQKVLSALIKQYPNHTLTPSFSAYIAASADSLLPLFANASRALDFSMDRLSAGNALIHLASTTGKAEYKQAVSVLEQSVALNKRNSEDGLWYYVYPNWSYLDGMFSFGPFWALDALEYDANNATRWVELRRQYGLIAEHCKFNETALLVHGYDASHTAVWANNSLGQSPHVWGRSLGWYVLGLLDTVSIIDEHAARTNLTEVRALRDDFVAEFQTRMRAIADIVDAESGAWWQLLDAPGREGNYIESSASAMFTWALLKGVRKGYLPEHARGLNASYVEIGRRAYGHLKEAFVVENGNGTLGWNGTVSVCSLNSTASYEYYTQRPILYDSVLGSAPFVGASMEVERLGGCEDSEF